LDGVARLSATVEISCGYEYVAATVLCFPANKVLEGLWVPQVLRHDLTFQARLKPFPPDGRHPGTFCRCAIWADPSCYPGPTYWLASISNNGFQRTNACPAPFLVLLPSLKALAAPIVPLLSTGQ